MTHDEAVKAALAVLGYTDEVLAEEDRFVIGIDLDGEGLEELNVKEFLDEYTYQKFLRR